MRKKDYLPFKEARDYVRGLGLKSAIEWREWAKSIERPNNIPSNPNLFYKDQGWINWGNFLGTGRIAKNKKFFLSFEEARDYARGLKLSSQKKWFFWARSEERPYNIQFNPDRFYKDQGWISWMDFLGKENKRGGSSKNFLPFEEAKEYVRSLELRSFSEWIKWTRSGERPDNIPSNPGRSYKDKGWIGLNDFLGKEDLNK